MASLRRKIHEVLEPGEQASTWERWVDALVIVLILVSVVVVVLESMPEMVAWDAGLRVVEAGIVYFFTVEYLLRLWTAPEARRYGAGWRGRLRYACSTMALIDLAAIVPFYLDPLAAGNAVVFRLLRIFRLIRVLKLGRYHDSFSMLIRVVRLRRAELVASLVLVLCLVVIASTMMYAVEHDAQPKAFASIPASLWWGIVTMTTVGYGDVYPVTPAGRVIAGISVLLSVGLFALPAGLLASGFSEELDRRRARKQEGAKERCCPHCGKPMEEEEL